MMRGMKSMGMQSVKMPVKVVDKQPAAPEKKKQTFKSSFLKPTGGPAVGSALQ